MTDYLKILYQEGRREALELQERSQTMTGTELNAEDDKIPAFREAVKVMNMLNRPVGFVCRSSAGRVGGCMMIIMTMMYQDYWRIDIA